jgi:hypothetical protein
MLQKKLISTAKKLPPAKWLIRQLKARYAKEPLGGFYSLSPDLLIALTKAFNLQEKSKANGKNLFQNHGYYEFGLFRGFSLWFAEQLSRQYTDSTFQFYGFDSFEGLPKPQLDVEANMFNKGDFCGSYEAVTNNLLKWKAETSRIKLYKGFYSKDLFARFRDDNKFPPASICVIDVDLYESCVDVLEFTKEFLVAGSILLFDDYNQIGPDNNSGERRALIEFEKQNPNFVKEHLFDFGWEGTAFRVVSI